LIEPPIIVDVESGIEKPQSAIKGGLEPQWALPPAAVNEQNSNET